MKVVFYLLLIVITGNICVAGVSGVELDKLMNLKTSDVQLRSILKKFKPLKGRYQI